MDGPTIALVIFSSILFIAAIILQLVYIGNTIFNEGNQQRYQFYIYAVSGFSIFFHLIVAVLNCTTCCSRKANKITKISEFICLVILLFFQLGTTSVYVVVRQYINPYTSLSKRTYNNLSQDAYDSMPDLIIVGYIWALLLFVIIVVKSHIKFHPQLQPPPQPQQIVVYQQEMRPIQSERRLPES